MKWTDEAQDALNKVPFFVRKKAKSKIENYVHDKGMGLVVTVEDVKAAKQQFISGMSKNIKGYQADRCFGASGCPNSANSCESVIDRAQKLLENQNILSFLKKSVKGDLKYHHEFRLSAADCPNCCSQPQIKDFGIIGAVIPALCDETCSLCHACEDACPDNCIKIEDRGEDQLPSIDFSSCLMCGKCVEACPTGTICEQDRGFKIQLGGRLGRHPRLGLEIDRLFSEDEVIAILDNVLKFYKDHSKKGERFSKIFNETDMYELLH
ncbi:MAG: 4Fe-4S binding protein [Desulfamplus sp.]|nr:4Fe-4S binding protein [Desulfamplus sp.]